MGRTTVLATACAIFLAVAGAGAEPTPFAVVLVPPDRVADHEGRDPHGYPRALPDPVAVRELFARKRYSDLEAILTGLQGRFAQDFRTELQVFQAFRAFRGVSPEQARGFEAWREAFPGSWAARTAEGFHHVGEGWRLRGDRWANETSAAQIAGMHTHFGRAEELFGEALALEPRLLVVHEALINVARGAGDAELAARSLEAALAIQPDAYGVRAEYAESLTRRWGGSYEAQERFARDAQSRAGTNPRLALLLGLPHWDRARDHWTANEPVQAFHEFERALAAGENGGVLRDRADYYWNQGELELAQWDYDRAVQLLPHDARARHWRGRLLYELGRLDEGITELQRAAQLDPMEPAYASQLRWARDAKEFLSHPKPVQWFFRVCHWILAHAVWSGAALLATFVAWRVREDRRRRREPVSARADERDADPRQPLVRRVWRLYLLLIGILFAGDYAGRWAQLGDYARWAGILVMGVALAGGIGFTQQRRLGVPGLWRLWAWVLPAHWCIVWFWVNNWDLAEWHTWGFYTLELFPLWLALLRYGYASEHLWREEALPVTLEPTVGRSASGG